MTDEQVRVHGTTEHRLMPASLKRQHWPSAVSGALRLARRPVAGVISGWEHRGTYIPRRTRTGYRSTGNSRLDGRTHLSKYLVLSIPLIPDHSCNLLLHTSLLFAVVDDRVYTPRLTAWGFLVCGRVPRVPPPITIPLPPGDRLPLEISP